MRRKSFEGGHAVDRLRGHAVKASGEEAARPCGGKALREAMLWIGFEAMRWRPDGGGHTVEASGEEAARPCGGKASREAMLWIGFEAIRWRPCGGGHAVEAIQWRPYSGGHAVEKQRGHAQDRLPGHPVGRFLSGFMQLYLSSIEVECPAEITLHYSQLGNMRGFYCFFYSDVAGYTSSTVHGIISANVQLYSTHRDGFFHPLLVYC
jgi:hypothetical protein